MKWACDIAQRSLDPKLKVGCVIVSSDLMNVLATGYNGGAKGLSDERESLVSGKSGLIHAEANAITKMAYRGSECVVFLTHPPCNVCAKMLININATRVYYNDTYGTDGIDVLAQAGVECIQYCNKE